MQGLVYFQADIGHNKLIRSSLLGESCPDAASTNAAGTQSHRLKLSLLSTLPIQNHNRTLNPLTSISLAHYLCSHGYGDPCMHVESVAASSMASPLPFSSFYL
ncbi:hypothetical protein MPTK1_4g20840 [Marchantia polymorpha subsp. ruderalis]|uniref:Uncharacterized protein n=1 Tax=Marchantia polymorpha subsp. ruderalis TaxID=1480154 RepID=A0AAF6BC45_MARPO|nr:hypothetical protein Mp_4g20840 [Marchantia polymorpha subsp. ruderalis]